MIDAHWQVGAMQLKNLRRDAGDLTQIPNFAPAASKKHYSTSTARQASAQSTPTPIAP